MVRTYSGDANLCGNITSIKVSWMVTQAKKAYSDVDLIKRCAKVIVEEIADGKETKLIRKIDDIPLSADTATHRISSCIFNVNEQIYYDPAGSDAIAIAVDESTDVRNIEQCCIFVRFIDNNFRVTEDILHHYPLTGQTRGQDICNCVMETLHKFNISIEKIYSLITDGAPSMIGRTAGFTTLFKMHDETRNNFLSYHCIIHQENLVDLHAEMFDEVMKDIVDIINFIRAYALNHRQYRKLLNEYDTHYHELVYHSQVRWLSKGSVLDHFSHLFEPIKTYLTEHSVLTNKISNILNNFEDPRCP